MIDDFWYGSDVIQYNGDPSDVSAVIAAEYEHYNSFKGLVDQVRNEMGNQDNVSVGSEGICQQKKEYYTNLIDSMINTTTAYNSGLDAQPDGPHPTLGRWIKYRSQGGGGGGIDP